MTNLPRLFMLKIFKFLLETGETQRAFYVFFCMLTLNTIIRYYGIYCIKICCQCFCFSVFILYAWSLYITIVQNDDYH